MRELLNFPEDAFVVGMVANNQGQSPSRKAFSESLLAFSLFQQEHEDAILYMHAEMSGFRNGLDLMRMAERFEIPSGALRFSDQVMMEFGIPPGVLCGLYNTFDVLLHPSYGEGFGIPIIEAQACGCPVIVTDWTSMTELCGAGWMVGGTIWDHAMAEAFWMKPDVDQIVGALEEAYENRGNEQLRMQARAFAQQYDVDLIVEDYWKPALEQIQKPREVKPLRPSKTDIVVPELVAK
jgi:glycosyltransferase involved in cell wall biosynthesis